MVYDTRLVKCSVVDVLADCSVRTFAAISHYLELSLRQLQASVQRVQARVLRSCTGAGAEIRCMLHMDTSQRHKDDQQKQSAETQSMPCKAPASLAIRSKRP